MHKTYNPTTVYPPLSRYSHAVEIPASARRLYISGQLGIMPDGTLAEGFEAQAEWAWKNLVAILADAGMGVEHIVKYSTFLINADDIAANRSIRDRFLGENKPASTLLVISRLASPDFLIEIELVAAAS